METLIAIAALVVATGAAGSQAYVAYLHRRHMRLSLRPIASFQFRDYEDAVSVSLQNKGHGTMRVTSFNVLGGDESGTTSLIERMPELVGETMWNGYRRGVLGEHIQPGEELLLLRLAGDMEDEDFAASRDRVRAALAPLRLEVHYQDLYGERMNPHFRSCDWFGRFLAPPDAPLLPGPSEDGEE